MAISIVGSATQNQSTSSQTVTPGSGFTTGDIHLIRVEVKSGVSFPTNPASYLDVPGTTQSSSGNTLSKLIYRVLTSGDAAPSINGAGVAVMTQGITLRDIRSGAIADIVEVVSLSLNSSSSAINYAAATIATAGCMAVLFGTHGSSSSATFGTPTTLSGSAVNSAAAYAGTNLKSTIWTDLQVAAASIAAGNIPLTGASSQTNRSTLIVIRPAVSSTVTISDAGDERHYDGETSITITGTAFGASQGAGFVKVSPTDNIADGSALTQTVTAWSDTSITLTANLSSLAADTNLYLFVANNLGQSNASGFVIQRAKRFRVSLTLRDRGDGDDAAVPWASQTGLYYAVRPATSLTATAVLSGTDGSTDASGNFLTSYLELTPGGAVADGDLLLVEIYKPSGTPANRRATLVPYTPSYV